MSEDGFWSLRNAPAWWFDKRTLSLLAVGVALMLGLRWAYGPGRVPEGTVVVYGASWCPYTASLVKHLDASRIPYEERDVEASFTNLLGYMFASGRRGVLPVVLVGPRVVSKGFHRGEIDLALAQAGFHPDPGATGADGASERR